MIRISGVKTMFRRASLWAKIIPLILQIIGPEIGRQLRYAQNQIQGSITGRTPATDRDRNIVVIGASSAGWFAAQILAKSLPPNSPYRVVVIEPNSHFQFSWLLPRFCVIEGHEHKAFIPYYGLRKGVPEETMRWVKDWVRSITESHVKLQGGEDIPYEYLIIATGSGVKEGLPSRVNATDKAAGMQRLQELQRGIKSAKSVVVVGGGAAGVEVATDAKDLYPEKHVTIVHSRDALMHRFGKELQHEALDGMKRLGVEVILGERVVAEDAVAGTVQLMSGTVLKCDKLVNCTGQKPNSALIADLSPKAVSPSGHIKVKPTLQVDDARLRNVYACGDAADTKVPTPNARAASRQAMIAAENILSSLRGREPSHVYEYAWLVDSFIKLTLGLHRSTTYMGGGEDCILWRGKEPIDLMAKEVWGGLGAKPFEDVV